MLKSAGKVIIPHTKSIFQSLERIFQSMKYIFQTLEYSFHDLEYRIVVGEKNFCRGYLKFLQWGMKRIYIMGAILVFPYYKKEESKKFIVCLLLSLVIVVGYCQLFLCSIIFTNFSLIVLSTGDINSI